MQKLPNQRYAQHHQVNHRDEALRTVESAPERPGPEAEPADRSGGILPDSGIGEVREYIPGEDRED